jgi:hypothetical protein
MTFKVEDDRVNFGKGWFKIIKKIDPYEYLDEGAKKLIRQIKVDLLPASEERETEGECDCFALFEGKVGTGKSNAANLFCLGMDKTYTPERCIYRDWHYWKIKANLTKNLSKDMDACRGKAINIDELRRVLHAKDSLTPESKAIEKDLGDIRALGFFITACIDDVKSIMRYVRDTRIDLWFYCRRKGEIWIYKLYTTAKDSQRSERRIAYVKKMLLQGIHPYTPYKIRLKRIPHTSQFWIKFKQREMRYKGALADAKENIKLQKLKENVDKVIKDTLPFTKAYKYLNVSNDTLFKWRRKGKIKVVHTYKGDRYKIDDLNKLVKIEN